MGTGGIAATAGHFATSLPAAAAERTSREADDNAGRLVGIQRIVWSVDTDERAMALSFDDGPNPSYTPRVLELLGARGITATFFVIGEMVTQHPALARRVRDEGHELGNHSWAHHSPAVLSSSQVRDDIERGAAALREVLGVTPRWYRPPRGMLTGSAVHHAHRGRQQVAMWSVTRGPATIPATDIIGVRDHLAASFAPGAVIELHDGLGSWNSSPHHGEGPGLARRREAELAALPAALDRAQAAGYRFLTLSDLASLH
jgi:peptidoglycan/xylan/chitin deacetylase (PgdA/CDA1 family)